MSNGLYTSVDICGKSVYNFILYGNNSAFLIITKPALLPRAIGLILDSFSLEMIISSQYSGSYLTSRAELYRTTIL